MIVFYNPHVDDFLSEPPHFKMLKRRALKKYSYIFDGIVSEGERINVYIDYTLSAYIPDRYFCKLPAWLRKLIAGYEIREWLKINNFKEKADFFDIKYASDATLFGMSYKAAQGRFDIRLGNFLRFKKVIFHLSHYFISTDEKAINLKKVKNLWLCGDSDITNNAYFQKYFSWYQNKFLVIPFSVQERFSKKKEITDRQSEAVATGSFHNLYNEKAQYKYKAYLDFFNCSSYHPMRKILFDHKNELMDIVDVHVSEYNEMSRKTWIATIFSRFYVKQKKYFSFNIVDLYNDYTFAVVGEENVGFPAIGAFEAMACGCILIARPEYYQGLGIRAGIEYISYDGTLKSLFKVINELKQEEIGYLEKISSSAVSYISKHFRWEVLYKNFINALEDNNEN